MDSDGRKQAESLALAAMELPSGGRSEFLRQACGGDATLEREVRGRLAALQDSEATATQMAPVGWSGQSISHYRILEKLGAGGMGVVYKALDTRLDRMVALKFLPPNLSHDAELKQRLSDEARAASTLDHPNIVVIHDIDQTAGGDLFIAMAFHDGVTLQERMRQEKSAGGMPVADALQIARQVASGLARAHERGIFHRDIKPSNVIVAKDGVARIIDFGLAKSSQATVTLGSTKGTPLYMSPEQAAGRAVDFRTDLWSLGAVLYEMLAGKPPYAGETHLQVMKAIVDGPPPRLRDARQDLPAQVDSIVARALQKDPSQRYQSAGDMAGDLSKAIVALDAPEPKRSSKLPAYWAAGIACLLLAAVSFWMYQRSEKRHWAREQAIPEIERLKRENKPVAAFLLARKAQQYLPGDPQLGQLTDGLTHIATVRSSPPGALVEIKDYLSPGDPWFPLGTTPLEKVELPSGYLRWKVSKAGVGEYSGAPIFKDMRGLRQEFDFALDAVAKAPEGMTPVPANPQYADMVYSLGFIGPYDLPAFYMDRYEVTNRRYQEFVDQGGYQKREFWKEKFNKDGRELSWEQAMEAFRDPTGRAGPSTWEAGHYPQGQADYPVSGVSWYEAAAYAEFAHKSLPAVAQWYYAAPSAVAKYVTQLSNFSRGAKAPVGKHAGIGPWGTYDMGGNVAEWCWNDAGGGARYALGGSWQTDSSEYWEPFSMPPFTRSASNGFRCVKNSAALPAAVTEEVRANAKDFSKVKPVTDEIFQVYRSMYAYDATPLNVRREPTDQDSPDWHKEAVTFDAAYGKERVTAYLFLPVNVRPPYQTVLFFPSAPVLFIPSSKQLGEMQFIDYVIKSGRAVLYPVYKGTYERGSPESDNTPNTAAGKELLIQESKDVGRSVDYLLSRPDIDRNKIAYMGVSMGAALGVVFTAVDQRFKTVILLDGGFYGERLLPGTDPADFAPRLKTPVLMVGGKFDWIFEGKDALVRALGAPAADKKVVTLETAHDVSEQRADLMREVLAWLDARLGKVN